MPPYRCSRCKGPIGYKRGYCDSCQQIRFQEKIDKQIAKKTAKYRRTKEYGVSQVKKYADGSKWSGQHCGCFRASINETDEHMDTMYRLWKEYKKRGYAVYCNLVLKTGDKPDLVCVSPKGEIKIIEVVASESKASIESKRKRYPPFPIEVVKARKSV